MLSEDGNPRLDSLWAVMEAMGLRIVPEPIVAVQAEPQSEGTYQADLIMPIDAAARSVVASRARPSASVEIRANQPVNQFNAKSANAASHLPFGSDSMFGVASLLTSSVPLNESPVPSMDLGNYPFVGSDRRAPAQQHCI
jgi:hypothetical protein